MRNYMKELKLVTLKLSRNTTCKLLKGLDELIENKVEGSEVYRAIRCLIQVQLDEHDAKEATKYE